MYDEACAADKALFAEMRTNVRLRNGDHYNNATRKIVDGIRHKGAPIGEQKIRITKNHIHRITNEFVNAILSRNPSVEVRPFNDGELSDMKNAEMANAVLRWIKDSNSWISLRDDFVQEQSVVGETYGVLRFEPDFGKQIGSKIKQDKDGNEMSAPVMEGRIVIDKRFGFDMKRDPNARSFAESRYVFFDKLVDMADAKRIIKSFGSEQAQLDEFNGGDGVVTVFDYSTSTYTQDSQKTLFREMYIRPDGNSYPNGRYILSTKHAIVYQTDLPLSMFPVHQLGFDKITTSPRCSAITRVARPFQIEINRASSKQAEHQVTVGDDKVILTNGSKITNGGKAAGVRVLSVDGAAPMVIAGRAGEQYAGYAASETRAMYEACGVGHLMQDAAAQGGDAFALLHRSMSQKAAFVPYISKWEQFETELFRDALKLAKAYLTPLHVIKIVGKKDAVNIEEFKGIDDDGYDIRVEASSGDVETKFGKLLTVSQTLQYAGSSMTSEQIGQLVKQLPYGNSDEVFNTLTIGYDTAVNTILALDRGDTPVISQYGDNAYLLKALTNRIVQSDFRFLGQNVQAAYAKHIQQLEMLQSQQTLQAQQAAQGMIPASGFLTTVNASWKNPSTGRVERIKVPSDAIAWLMEKMSSQGVVAAQSAQFDGQSQANIANMVTTQSQAAQQPELAPQMQGVPQ